MQTDERVTTCTILLQSGASITTKQGNIYYRKGCFTTKLPRYYKLGQELSQSAAGNS